MDLSTMERKRTKQITSKQITSILFAFLISIVLTLSVFAQESSPQLPHLFYGAAKVNGTNLPSGSVIIAKVSGAEKGRITTTEAGKYGGASSSESKLVVQGAIDENAQIDFFVNRIAANEVAQFKSGKIENKNLTWNFTATIDFGEGLPNEPYTCIPGTDIKISIAGLTLTIKCASGSAGTINNVSNLGAGFLIGAPAPGGVNNLSNTFEISITGNVDIIVTMSYNDAGIDESTVRPYKFVGGVWVAVPDSDIISRDTTANKITFKVTPGGTPYATFGSAPTPPAPTGAAVTGGGGGGGGGGGCTYDWQCTSWSACSPNGKQTRTCTNKGTCIDNYGKPAESQDCVYTALEGKEEAGVPSAPPEDVCPNIEGVQTQVPAGMVKDADGNCVAAAPTLPTGFAIFGLQPGTLVGAIIALVLVAGSLYVGYRYLYKKK